MARTPHDGPGHRAVRLPEARVGPYVRALASGLHALAPNTDWVPLDEQLAHLRALDPALSGRLLAPAEVDPRTGMPSFPWFERVSAEARVAATRPETRSDAELERVRRLDPELAARLRWRRDLHSHLASRAILPSSRAEARARRLDSATEVLVFLDRVLPDGLWVRVSLVLAAPPGRTDLGVVRVVSGGRVHLDEGLLHLVSRHISVPLLALRAQIAAVTEGRVRRVCRATIGPFWFPGIALPDGVPPALGQGLLLHAAYEVVGDDVRHSSQTDPLVHAVGLELPEGHGVVRGRRFACSTAARRALQSWCEQRGVPAEIVGLG